MPIVYLDGVIHFAKYQGAIVVLRRQDYLVEVVTLNGDDILAGDIARIVSYNIAEYHLLTYIQSLILSMLIHALDGENSRIRRVIVLADVTSG
ncbi:hypothetical protein [Xylanibacter ruminicola]|uniref:hypothetical protein n=1 Tax=Xylanibacter ruminicola TaxID=839 RepID=UPI0011B06FD7|nr:hypothetical protein [Xylanibacter ruminicola]